LPYLYVSIPDLCYHDFRDLRFCRCDSGMGGILCNLVDMYWHIRVPSFLYNHGRSALMMEAAGFSETCIYIYIYIYIHTYTFTRPHSITFQKAIMSMLFVLNS